MKTIYRLSIVATLFASLVLLNACTGLGSYSRSNAIELEGLWRISFGGGWSTEILIESDPDQGHRAWLKTSKDDYLYQTDTAGKVSFRRNVLSIVTNPEAKIVFRGKYNKENSLFNGALHYPNGSKHDCRLIKLESGSARGFFPRENRSTKYHSSAPHERGDQIPVGSLRGSGLDAAAVDRMVEAVLSRELGEIHSILIYMDNGLVVEEYFYGYGVDDPHRTHSVTKSVFSLLAGIAMETNESLSIDSKIGDLLPNLGGPPPIGNVKLVDLMSMASGLDTKNITLDDEGDWIDSLLDISPQKEQIGRFEYDDQAVELCGFLVSDILERSMLNFGQEQLFNPMGIKPGLWETWGEGYNKVSTGLSLTSRDMLKIGILVMQGGIWDDRQLVPKDWIEFTTTMNIEISEEYGYGRLWWLLNGKSIGLEGSIPVAQGAGCQRIFIIPQIGAVCVITGGNFNDHYPMASYLADVLSLNR